MRTAVPIALCVLALAAPLAARAVDDAGLTLHVLDCGAFAGMDAEAFLPDVTDRPETLDMVNRCFLVVHPQGTLLWDAGLPTGFGATLQAWAYRLLTLFQTRVTLPETSVLEQIEALGLSASDVDLVAFSHSHFDHVGQAADFADATWLVQKVEYDWLVDPEMDNDAVQKGLLEPLLDAKKQLLEGDHDVFGDGTVVILSAPGHTPGHQCLLLDLPETGPIVLSGDLYHSLPNREHREPPDFNTDRAQTRVSMERIEGYLTERGATLWIQHSPESGIQAPAVVR